MFSSKRSNLIILILVVILFIAALIHNITEYSPNKGGFFSQFTSSTAFLSGSLLMLYHYLKALKEEKKIKQKE